MSPDLPGARPAHLRRHPTLVQLVGGPKDGQEMTLTDPTGWRDEIRIPIRPPIDLSLEAPADGPEIAIYRLVEGKYVTYTETEALQRDLAPGRHLVEGRYQYVRTA